MSIDERRQKSRMLNRTENRNDIVPVSGTFSLNESEGHLWTTVVKLIPLSFWQFEDIHVELFGLKS